MKESYVLIGAESAVFTRGLVAVLIHQGRPAGIVGTLATRRADELLAAQAEHLPQFGRS